MKTKFPYRKEESELLGLVYRPVVDFEVKTTTGWIPVIAYADSGADITLLPKSFIELLGIAFEEKDITDIGGVGGGKVPVIVKETELKICGKIIKAKVAIALIEEIPYLLGREDIFDFFKVCFRQKVRETYLKLEE